MMENKILNAQQDRALDALVEELHERGGAALDHRRARMTTRELYISQGRSPLVPIVFAGDPLEAVAIASDLSNQLLDIPEKADRSMVDYIELLDSWADQVHPSYGAEEINSLYREALTVYQQASASSYERGLAYIKARIHQILEPDNIEQVSMSLLEGAALHIGDALFFDNMAILIERPEVESHPTYVSYRYPTGRKLQIPWLQEESGDA